MDTIKVIDPYQDKRWDFFVENHPWGWVSQLSDWGKILEECFKHIKGYYLAIFNEDNQITGGLPIFSCKSWLTGKRLVSIPHATLSDPLVSSLEGMSLLLDATIKLSKTLGIKNIEIRTLMSSPFFPTEQFEDHRYFQHHYIKLMPDPEELRKSFHRTCVRQRISRALGSKLELRIGEKESDLAAFYQLHILTRKRHGLPPQPYKFFRLLWDTFYSSNRIKILYAMFHDQPVAALILLNFKNRMSAEFAASNEQFRDLSPNHLLFWEAIKMACLDGFEIFDFGRTPPRNSELMEFKRRWGTKMKDLPHFYYPKQRQGRTSRDSQLSYRLIQTVCRKAPNSILPNIGRFCYAHLS